MCVREMERGRNERERVKRVRRRDSEDALAMESGEWRMRETNREKERLWDR